MSYEKKVWKNGDIITADLLNHMEEGIENAKPGFTCVDGELTEVSDCFGEAVNLVIPIKRVKDDADADGGVILGNVKPEYVEDEEFINSASGHDAVAEGFGTTASGDASHAEGRATTASGEDSHAEGNETTASGISSHAEGIGSLQKQTYKDGTNAFPGATTVASHVEGFNTRVQDGMAGHAEGYITLAGGAQPPGSHAEGYNTVSKGGASHAEGLNTTASGVGSHAEGNNTTASGQGSHAEGNNTTASSEQSHAEGFNTTASEVSSHAEGYGTTASGNCSHAEGGSTIASGNYSHAEGGSTIANHRCQHVYGECNIADPSSASADARGNFVEIIGNGTDDTHRSNARTLDWQGNEKLAGGLTLGLGTADEVTISAAQLKALLATLS